jgi:hypothetical protein
LVISSQTYHADDGALHNEHTQAVDAIDNGGQSLALVAFRTVSSFVMGWRRRS